MLRQLEKEPMHISLGDENQKAVTSGFQNSQAPKPFHNASQ